MPELLTPVKRRVLWVIARICFTVYPKIPIFGALRASIAIIHRDRTFLVIQRNDARGLSLPGGIARWREREELTLRREVHEETGLSVTGEILQLRYFSRADVPCNISVFEAEASGELKDSWEGSPRWMSVEEIEPRLLDSQRPVLELLRKIAGEASRSGAQHA